MSLRSPLHRGLVVSTPFVAYSAYVLPSTPWGWALGMASLGSLAVTLGLAARLRVDEPAGELMLEDGQVLSLVAWRRVQQAFTLSMVLALLDAVALLLDGEHGALPSLTMLGWPAFMLVRSRQSRRDLAAIQRFFLGEAHRIDPSKVSPLLRASTWLETGRVADARAQLEALAPGPLTLRESDLVVLRMHDADTTLGHRVLVAEPATTLLDRYRRALVEGHLAVLTRQPWSPGPLIDAVHPYFAHELHLLDAAIARQQGDEPRAEAALARAGSLSADGWRALAHPALWEALGPATREVPLPQVPTAVSPPAPPSPPRRFALSRAILPVETIGLPIAPTSLLDWLVWALAVTLLLLHLPMWWMVQEGMLPTPDLPALFFAALLLLASWFFVALTIARDLDLRTLHRYQVGEEAAQATDGTRVRGWSPQRWWFASLGVVPPALVVLGCLTLLVNDRNTLLMPFVAVGAVAGFVLWVTSRVQRLVWAVHFGTLDDVATQSAWIENFNHGGAWLVLAHLIQGNAAAAASVAARLCDEGRASHVTQELRTWIQAAEGRHDLDRLIEISPEGEGPTYRHAVTLRLAALAAGRPHAVRDRIGTATIWPNRFGALLLRLDHAILERTDPEAATAYATAHPELAEGRWIDACWPALFALDPP